MADTAAFIVKLKDQMSDPARRAAKQVKGLNSALRKVEKRGVSAEAALAQIRREYNRANSAALKSAQANDKFAGTLLRGGAMAAGTAVVAAGFAAVAGSAYLANKAISRAAETETHVYALERLTHHGRKSFNEIRDLAIKLGLDIDDTAHSYANFLKLQFSEPEAKKFIKLGADMQALGNTADDVKGIFRAIGQIRSKGRLQAEEMLQLAERGVSGVLIRKQIAQAMGIAEDEVEKAQRDGKVTWDIAGPAIERALNQKLGQKEAGEAGLKFADETLTGAKNRMRQKAKSVWIDLADAAEPGIRSGMSKISGAFDALLNNKEAMAQAQHFMDLFGRAIDRVASVIAYALPVAREAVYEFTKSFGAAFGESSLSADYYKTILKGLVPVAKMLGSAFGLLAKAITEVNAAVQKGALAIGWLATFGGSETDDELAAIREQVKKRGLAVGEGFAAGIREKAGDAALAGAELVDAADSGAVKKAKIHSPSRLMAARGEMMSAGFGQGMQTAAPSGAEMMSGLDKPGGALFGSAKGAGGSVSIGDVVIQVQGSADPQATAAATLAAFERNLGSIMTRYASEAAA